VCNGRLKGGSQKKKKKKKKRAICVIGIRERFQAVPIKKKNGRYVSSVYESGFRRYR
jgi:hypothetical protein